MDDTLVLNNEPLPETEATVTLDIQGEEEDSTEESTLIQRKGLGGKLTFNPERCLIFSIPPSVRSVSPPMIMPDRTQWDLYLIIIPFTLHEAPSGQFYEKMTFLIEMVDQKATAF